MHVLTKITLCVLEGSSTSLEQHALNICIMYVCAHGYEVKKLRGYSSTLSCECDCRRAFLHAEVMFLHFVRSSVWRFEHRLATSITLASVMNSLP